ncbi:MAG: TadE family protein [Marmoricola sp.]
MSPGAAHEERGSATVEFAIISTLLLMLVFGTIQYGLYFYAAQSGSSIAREAVRRASVGACTDSQLSTYVSDRIGGATAQRTFLKTDGTADTSPGTVGGVVQVTVTFSTYDLHLPFVPVPGSPATRVVQARLENNPSTFGPCV